MVMSLEDGDLGDRIEEWVKNGGTWIAGPLTEVRKGVGTHYTDNATGRIERMTGATLIGSILRFPYPGSPETLRSSPQGEWARRLDFG